MLPVLISITIEELSLESGQAVMGLCPEAVLGGGGEGPQSGDVSKVESARLRHQTDGSSSILGGGICREREPGWLRQGTGPWKGEQGVTVRGAGDTHSENLFHGWEFICHPRRRGGKNASLPTPPKISEFSGFWLLTSFP